MILINTKTNESYYNCSGVFIASKIGVHKNTVSGWKTSGRKRETYNYWIVYFDPTKAPKQIKGFALK